MLKENEKVFLEYIWKSIWFSIIGKRYGIYYTSSHRERGTYMRIEKIEVREPYRLGVWLENGTSFEYDFGEKVRTARFWELQAPEVFRSARVVGSSIQWNGVTEITVEELLAGGIQK